MKNTVENFQRLIDTKKWIWNKTFPDHTLGYLAIIEVPHGFIYDTLTSDSMKQFKAEIESFPYHYAWKISELKKVTTFINSLLDYLNEEQMNPEIEDICFEMLIQEIQPYIIHEIDPYSSDL
jgi:hypothetical protein